MKIFHLSDLHIGKRVCERSLIDDQKDIIDQIIAHVKGRKPDAVIIAGDVYDRSLPSEEAVSLFDDFLFRLSETGTPALVIGGNHDSQERVAYGGRIMSKNGIHIAPEFNKFNYEKILKPVVLSDNFGEINFYMLPFVTPASVRAARENTQASSYTEAVKSVIDDMNIDVSKRNILIAHQFVTGAETCESETFSVGGSDNVDASVFEGFDYVALGHLHGPQSVGKDTVRYSGTPLKYSFSEANHKKSICIVEIENKGQIKISQISLDKPLHDWKVYKGKFDEVISNKCDDYVKVILTDENEIFDAVNKLREYFPNIMQLSFENNRAKNEYNTAMLENIASMTLPELFAEFYIKQQGTELSENQKKIVENIFEEAQNETD
ncbi:MAG: exonuclease SbcCD subunit D [Eubacterium sp.]|nr:exonuclease SbcCD subunit D [Eubacterium sp.]